MSEYLLDGSCDCVLCRESMRKRWESHLKQELQNALDKIKEYQDIEQQLASELEQLSKMRNRLRETEPDNFKILDVLNVKIDVLNRMRNMHKLMER